MKKKRIAILATDGFEESELSSPRDAMKDHGFEPIIVSPKSGSIKSWKDGNWGENFDVDMSLDEANPQDFDGLMLPGGVINPDQLRRDHKAIEFVRSFFNKDSQRPVAAICHGPATLATAEVLKDRKLTSYDSIKSDLEHAGAHWVDKEVVCDQGLVTARTPDDLKAFNQKMIEEFKEGKHTDIR